tara:strand:- start:787 stop:1377 length:591 start_codon:yes stop_codon:yes gene_type:complete
MSYIKYNFFLNTILNNIVPETKIAISKGNKIFGAAIITKKDYKLITVGTNNEIVNPLFHGEISALNNYFKLPLKNRPNMKDCFFLTSHEPCSLCLSAITWSGFNNFYYFFPYTETNNNFKIPHDLKILDEVFYIKKGNYNKKNKYWKSYSILKQIKSIQNTEQEKLNVNVRKIYKIYSNLSNLYQKSKSLNKIPLN